MRYRYPQTWLSLLLCLVLVFAVSGCQKKAPAKPMAPKKESAAAGQKPKPPKTAESMSKEIDKIIQDLDKKARQKLMPELAEPAQPPPKTAAGGSSQQAGGQSQDGQQSGQKEGSSGQKASAGQDQGQKKPSPAGGEQPKPEQEWQPIAMSLMKIHQSWNEFEPEAAKAGMTNADRDAFETSLDKLTQAAGSQKLPESMKAATDLYRDFGTIVSYFAYPLPRDYFLVNYEIMGTMAAAFSGNWTVADQHIKQLEEPWLRLQMQLDKEQKADADRTSFAIKDLTQAVEQKDVNLTFIKGEIVIKDLKKIAEKLSKKQGQG